VVGVVIPAFNESDAIGRVLEALPRQLVSEIVVVDNGSTDGTAEVARAGGATVVYEPRRGYGRACLKGISHFRRLSPSLDILVFLDADFSDHPEEMGTLLEPIYRGDADLVIGSRVRGSAQPGALLPQARLGNRLATALIGWIWKVPFTDLGPFRAIRFEALERLGMRDEGFGWTVEMQIKAARLGLKCVEVPVSYRRRVGRSKITGTFRGTLSAGTRILWTILREALKAGRAPGEKGRIGS
jgi:hypothetical protein